jgi:hypothetical protein
MELARDRSLVRTVGEEGETMRGRSGRRSRRAYEESRGELGVSSILRSCAFAVPPCALGRG